MQTLRKLIWFASVLALVGGAVFFAVGNQAQVPVYYLFGRSEAQPLWMVAGAAFALGGLAAWLVVLWVVSRAKLAERRHRKHAERLEAELHELRNLPLARDTTSSLADEPARRVAPGPPAPSAISPPPSAGGG